MQSATLQRPVFSRPGVNLDQPRLAEVIPENGMSPSKVHAAMRRSLAASLALRDDNTIFPNIRNLEEFLIHGLKYVFVPDRGELSRGIPTLYAAAPLKGKYTALVQLNEVV
jgi:hypothetical protein